MNCETGPPFSPDHCYDCRYQFTLQARMLARIRDSALLSANPRLSALLRNVGVLITGNALNGVLSLVYLAIITRALGLEQFGLYGLYMAYVGLFTRLTGFQTWQGLIAFGTPAYEKKDRGLLLDLLCLGSLLDFASGIVGYVLALLIAVMVPFWFGLGEDASTNVAIVASMLIFNWRNIPVALLRIYDAFLPQAVFSNVASALQLVAVSILYWQGEERMIVYLTVTTINNIVGQLGFYLYAVWRAHKDGLFSVNSINLRTLPARCPGITKFLLATNGDGFVRVLRDLDVFIVNALLGIAAAGLYRIARLLTRAIGQLTGPFYQSIYPELARFLANNDHTSMVQLMRQSAILLGSLTLICWLGFMLLGKTFLALVFGADFTAAYSVAAWCIGGMVVWGATHPLSPAMMAWHQAGTALKINFATTCIYVVALYLLTSALGLEGAGVALLTFYIIWGIVMSIAVSRHFKSLRARS